MAQNISVIKTSPYFDDYSPNKDYIRVLFRPSYPVQARELTTLQTFLQEQISRFGSQFFRDGVKLSNAKISISRDANRLNVTGSANSAFPPSGALSSAILSNLESFRGLIISNATGTVKARVVMQPEGVLSRVTGSLYVKYLTAETFPVTGGYFYALQSDNPTINQNLYNTFDRVTEATLANIPTGIYYVKGVFTRVEEQTVVVDTSSSTPSCDVGFIANEVIITPNEDPTLFDNARGSTNEGSPGAHRLKIQLSFVTKATGVEGEDFYRVLTLVDGVIQDELPYIDPVLEQITDILARRTFDESGNYALNPFTHVVTDGDTNESFQLTVGPSKAYVKGYEITKNFATVLDVDKGLTDTQSTSNYKVAFEGTTSVPVTGASGVLPGHTAGLNPYTNNYRLLLRNSSNAVIGVANAYGLFVDTSRGVTREVLHVYDVKMFTVITVDNAGFRTALTNGNSVESRRSKATVYNVDGSAGIANGITLTDVTATLNVGQPITSANITQTANITGVTTFSLANVATVTGNSGGFTATVSGDWDNGNTQLVKTVDKHIKTFKDANSNIIDNSFTILNDAAGTPGLAANGAWNRIEEDDGNEIRKNLRFRYLKVRHAANTAARSGINYGWVANDKEISLHYSDIYQVYGVNQSTANTFATGRFSRIRINTTGVIPQGTIVRGNTSGTEAIVALSNSTAGTGVGTLSNNANYHAFETNTNASDLLEVIYQKGSAFTVGETLSVINLDSTAIAFTNIVTFVANVAATGSDVSGLFELDDGQRAEFYDIGRLQRKSNAPQPTNDIIVFYSYFEANTNTGHYYSTDSYRHLDFWRVDPRFYETVRPIGTKTHNTGRELRNSIDMRFRATPITQVTASPFGFESRSYSRQSRVLPKTSFTTDLVEYLGRVDLVVLNKDGQMVLKKGVPSTNPQTPEDLQDAMTLSTVIIPPAVRYPNEEVVVTVRNNKRYTMEDIGKLERRIRNVEEAVTLSLLESQALNDDISGRTKMGFVVDDFTRDFGSTDTPADFDHEEFRASINTQEGLLHAGQNSGVAIPMAITNTSNVSNYFPGYLIPSFTETKLAEQMFATSTYLINPFAVWLFRGELRLNPPQDNIPIRRDNYFIERFGRLEPVGLDEFIRFGQITTTSPGGSTSTLQEWIGAPTVQRNLRAREQGFNRGGLVNITTQAQITTTTTTFDSPRASGVAVTTQSGTSVIENPAGFNFRSISVSFTASDLRPNTEHELYFNGVRVSTNVVSDVNGTVGGSFVIPPGIPVGTVEVVLKDVLNGTQSSATSGFRAVGHVSEFSTIQGTTTSVSTSSIANNVVRRVDFHDPVAQLFMLPTTEEDGITTISDSILTSVDIWFGFVDMRPGMNKVTVEIREAVNGYPGGPNEIIGSSGSVTLTKSNQVSRPTAQNATNIKMLEPVELKAQKEYAIVIKSPSDAATVFIARIGEKLLDGSGTHTDQPLVGGYAGSFFKSQNSSTWEADQNVDLTFKIYRAKFNANTESSFVVSNVISNSSVYAGDVGAFNDGLVFETFAGSNFVKVNHPNHGLNFDGARVTISGLTNTTNYHGIPGSQLNGLHDVYFATLDSYFIKTTANATVSGTPPVPKFTVFASQCVAYDQLITNFMMQKHETDTVNQFVRTTVTSTSDLRVDSSISKIYNNDLLTPFPSPVVEITPTRLIRFDKPRIVRNLTNAVGRDLEVITNFKPGSEYTAPYLRTGTNFDVFTFRNIFGNSITDSDIEGLTVRTPAVGDNDTNEKHASYIAALQSEKEHNAYVTKQIDIDIPADGLTLFFDADMQPDTAIEVSYKVRKFGDEIGFDSIEWRDFPNAQQITEENFGPFSSDFRLRSYTVRAQAPFEFTSFKVRVRMRTKNEAFTPYIKSLRIIADL